MPINLVSNLIHKILLYLLKYKNIYLIKYIDVFDDLYGFDMKNIRVCHGN